MNKVGIKNAIQAANLTAPCLTPEKIDTVIVNETYNQARCGVLTDHIKGLMQKIDAYIALLRSALTGLIGADTEDELRQMEAALRTLPAPAADKTVSINAIHALLATAPAKS